MIIYLQPKASQDRIIGLHNNALKISITAPPVDGAANAHLIKFLAKQFDVAKQNINILRGDLGRHKTVTVQSPKKLPDLIAALLS